MKFVELFKKAYQLFKDSRFDEAQNALTEAEENFEDNNEANLSLEDIYVLRGVIALEQEDVEFALDSFQRALELNPESVEACLGLGQIFFIAEMKEEAKKMFEWAVKNEPENIRAQVALQNINKHLGYPQEHNSLEDEMQTSEDNDNYDEAYKLFLDNKYSEALERLAKIQDKTNEDVLLLKGNILLADNDLEGAKEVFQKVLELNKFSAPALIGLAEYFYKKGMFHDSKVMYEQALKIEPNDEYALVGLAKVNHELGLSPVHNLNDVVPEDISAKIDNEMQRAFEKFEEKEFGEAVEILSNLEKEIENEEFENKNDILARINNFKGFNYLSQNKLADAQETFEKALELNPNSSQACAGLGEVFYLTGNDKQAKIMYEWAVKNNPQNAFAHAGLAKVNKSLGLPADHNTLKLGIDIDDSEKFNELVTSAYEKFMNKDFEGTIIDLREARKFYDEEPEVKEAKISLASLFNFEGYAYLGLNNLERAREAFEHALVLNPNSSQACAGLGEVFYLLEQDENAKVMYEWALRNEPGNKFAEAGLKKVSEALADETEKNSENAEKTDEEILDAKEKIEQLIEDAYDDFAIKEFREAIDKLVEAEKLVIETFEDQDKSFALSSINNFLGFNFLGIQENEKAKEHFEKSIQYNPQTAQGYAGLGTVNYLMGNDEEAKRLLQKSLEINPNNKYALSELVKVNKALGIEEDEG